KKHMTPSRHLLLVDPCEACLDAVPPLENCGWTVANSKLNTITSQHFDVGLVRLRETHVKRPSLLRSLLGRNGTEWLAAVTSDDMRCPVMRDFVGEWFFD